MRTDKMREVKNSLKPSAPVSGNFTSMRDTSTLLAEYSCTLLKGLEEAEMVEVTLDDRETVDVVLDVGETLGVALDELEIVEVTLEEKETVGVTLGDTVALGVCVGVGVMLGVCVGVPLKVPAGNTASMGSTKKFAARSTAAT